MKGAIDKAYKVEGINKIAERQKEMFKNFLQYIKKTTITLFLILIIATTMIFALPLVDAADITSYAFIGVAPNPQGIGQETQITLIVQPFPPGGDDIYHGFDIKVTLPDGTTTNLQKVDSDTTGSSYARYTPTTVGTYKFQFTYPGETFRNLTVKGSTSNVAELVVQTDPIPEWPQNPVPTGYWTRPVSAYNKNWGGITGDWLLGCYDASGRIYGTNNGFNPYTQAPRSAHVMWTKPLRYGGLTGGELGDASYDPGLIYENMMGPPIVMGGILYYRLYKGSSGASGPYRGFQAVDLRTGEVLFTKEGADVNNGQTYLCLGINGQGVQSFLWDTSVTSTMWKTYDPVTGADRANFTNTLGNPGTNILFGERGDIYAYFATGSGANRRLIMWNSSKCLIAAGWLQSEGSLRSDRIGSVDWRLGIQLNVTLHPSPAGFGDLAISRIDTGTNTLFMVANEATGDNNGHQYIAGYDAFTGAELWYKEWQFLGGRTSRIGTGEGTYSQFNPGTLQYSIFDVRTGQEIKTQATVPPWGSFTGNAAHAYGNIYYANFDGHVYCFNAKTGAIEWSYFSGNSGEETPYGWWPFFGGPVVGGDVVIANNDEHTPSQPLYRGSSVVGLDAHNGNLLWKIEQMIGTKAIADGYFVGYNAMTSEIWVIGKGPSATTVKLSDGTITQGGSVTITGSVVDMSEGQKGTPAISDVDQGAWQVYLHAGFEVPGNATGVPVYLSAVSSDGQSEDLGYVTSDISGMFMKMWTPPSRGEWKVYATFMGTDSYGSSYAEAGLGVAPQIAAEPEQALPPIDMYLLGATIAIIAAIAIAVLLLRKK